MLYQPVVAPAKPAYETVSDAELRLGRDHAQREYSIDPDPDLLRLCANTTLERWRQSRKVILPFLAATVVRETVPPKTPNRLEKIEALKGAVMKIMSARGHFKKARNAAKRERGVDVPATPRQTEHPDDMLRPVKGGTQLILI